MLSQLIENEVGVYVVSLAIAVGVGLMLDLSSRRAWIGSLLVTGAFVVLGLTVFSGAVWAVPIYVVVVVVAALLSETHRLADSPLLAGEPYWKRVALTASHGRAVREAAKRADALPRNTIVDGAH